MNDSRAFTDAESVRSGLSHVPSQPALLPPFRDPCGMLSRSVGMPTRNDKPPDIWDTHGVSGNVFLKPPASSSAPYPQFSIRGAPMYQYTHHRMSRVTAKHKTQPWIRDASQDRQPDIHSTPRRDDFSNNYEADQQRLQISDLHFDKFPNPATFACWKMRFKTEVCTCSQFPTEAMLWIKEVEMVESVDDLKTSRSIQGTQGPDF